MDLLEELERMAQNAPSDSDAEASPDETGRWQRLFCYSHGQAASLIAKQKSDSLFVRVTGRAEKSFSADSIFPTQGVDSTLPQNRAASEDTVLQPTQKQHPVMYFVYGTLADCDVLSRHLGLGEEEMPVLQLAGVRGGRLECWAGKYKALVDAPSGDVVSGFAYEVTSEEHEDALRAYETDNYGW